MTDDPGIYYIYLAANSVAPSSVQQKITNQIRIARELGFNIKGLFFTAEPVNKNKDADILWFQAPAVNNGYFRSIRQYALNVIAAMAAIKEIDAPGTRYFMRFGICNGSMFRLSLLLKGRIVFNHLSVETNEYALYQSDAVSFASRGLSNIEFKWLPIFLDKTLGKFIRRNSLSAVVNSEEIALRQQNKCLGKYPCEIIPDAVDTTAFPVLSAKKFGDNISMVFLKGASMDAEYNGLDRLMKGILEYNGPRNYTLTIIGNHTTMEENMVKNLGLPDRVFIKKALFGNELDNELENHHLGVGPLAVHRKGITATSSIKTREFMARGLPFFIAHKDHELADNIACRQFHTVFEASESPIQLSGLDAMFDRLNNMPDYPHSMREVAQKHLDYRVKIPQWISFISR
jgi:hypothetical protein